MVKFEFRGKSLEEIEQMEFKDFLKIMRSRERRSLKRGFTFSQKKLLKNIQTNRKKFHRTKSRDMIVIPEMFGVKMGIHNGKEYVPLEITPDMVGRRLGELILTRRKVAHSSPGFGATRSSKFVPLK